MSLQVALGYLRTDVPSLRIRAIGYLTGTRNRRALDALVRALDDSDDTFRSTIASIFGWRGERYDLLAAHLTEDPSPKVRYWCLRAFHPDIEGAAEAYLVALRDSDETVLDEACIEAGKVQGRVPRVAQEQMMAGLRRLLDHSSWKIRWQACATLYKLGSIDQQVVSTLEALRNQPDAVEHDRCIVRDRMWERVGERRPPGLFTTEELLATAKTAFDS